MKATPKRTVKRKSRRGAAERSVGERIIEGLTEVRDALAAGESMESRFTVRTYRLPDPGEYDAASVKRTRLRVKASQALFAKLLGASPALVRAWELGTRRPSPMARRMLDQVNREPTYWAGLIAPAYDGRASRA